ncbi:Itaconate transport protein [Colletotrichum sp. SAR 10_65]|nr:Itaconate transport protein [Colletotrichum sp. SAR 10_65]
MALPRYPSEYMEMTDNVAGEASKNSNAQGRLARDLGHRPGKSDGIVFREDSYISGDNSKYDFFPRAQNRHKSLPPLPLVYMSSSNRPEKLYDYDSSGASTPRPSPDPPYHVFSKNEKWMVIVIIGAAGLFSGLSSNIYFPSLDAIAQDLKVSLNMVSLTITSYLIIQGISPLLWGSISDVLGRRPIYIASFAVYIIANIALSFSPSFAILLVFRGLQAAGSASTVSIVRNFSIAVGPVLGGLLSNYFGFRSIFVFLLIISTITLAVIITFLPETMRSIAGNGSIRLDGMYRPLARYIRGDPEYVEQGSVKSSPRKKVTFMTFVEPLRLLIQKDILINLVFGGIIYAIWSMVTSSTTGIFKESFGLNELQIGLCYLPNGLGTIVGSTIVGKLMNKDFAAAEAAYKSARNEPSKKKLSSKDVPADFPIERARLQRLPWAVVIFVITTAGYGFSMAYPSITSLAGWIAVPLVLQFFIAATSNAVFALNQTLVSDLCPGKGASATAINNLVRCSLGAVGVAFVEQMIALAGVGPTFLGLALITVSVTPLAVIHWNWGQQWRAERMMAKEVADEENAKSKN